jgi:hypothetical protein
MPAQPNSTVQPRASCCAQIASGKLTAKSCSGIEPSPGARCPGSPVLYPPPVVGNGGGGLVFAPAGVAAARADIGYKREGGSR